MFLGVSVELEHFISPAIFKGLKAYCVAHCDCASCKITYEFAFSGPNCNVHLQIDQWFIMVRPALVFNKSNSSCHPDCGCPCEKKHTHQRQCVLIFALQRSRTAGFFQ